MKLVYVFIGSDKRLHTRVIPPRDAKLVVCKKKLTWSNGFMELNIGVGIRDWKLLPPKTVVGIFNTDNKQHEDSLANYLSGVLPPLMPKVHS